MWKMVCMIWNWQLIDALLIVCQKQIAFLQEEETLFPETCIVSLLCYLSLHNNYSIGCFANLWNNLTKKMWTPQCQVANDGTRHQQKEQPSRFFLIVRTIESHRKLKHSDGYLQKSPLSRRPTQDRRRKRRGQHVWFAAANPLQNPNPFS